MNLSEKWRIVEMTLLRLFPHETVDCARNRPVRHPRRRPIQRAFRRGDDEGGLRAFARGVLGPRSWERLSPGRHRQAFENLAPNRAQLLGAGLPPLDEGVLHTLGVPTHEFKEPDLPL